MARPRTGQKYVYSVLVDEETYTKILWNKNHREPLGSVVRRLIFQGILNETYNKGTLNESVNK